MSFLLTMTYVQIYFCTENNDLIHKTQISPHDTNTTHFYVMDMELLIISILSGALILGVHEREGSFKKQ